ncbi:MAG: hypothetical protein VB093_01970, partial [Propionicimonas sp.]|nr:hypothetical protein [Propionicimonas sp.]
MKSIRAGRNHQQGTPQQASRRSGAHRRGTLRRKLTGALALVALVCSQFLAVASPAAAVLGDQGAVTLAKTVEGAESVTVGLTDSFLYQFRVGCDDNDCIGVQLTDQLPAAFEGFTIDHLSVAPASAGTASLTGCSVGGTVTDDCQLTTDFTTKLGTLDGSDVVGIPAGTTYRVDLRLVVPGNLPASWPSNGVPVDNTAQATADNADTVEDSATVTVEIPVTVDVEASKKWSPATQQYEPGASSAITVGAKNTSNVPAATLVVTDAPGATANATGLDADNPFSYVDFGGLCSPSTLPAGADKVRVDLYVKDGGSWNWVNGTAAATASLPDVGTAEVGGIRFTYTSDEGATIQPGGTAAAQCVTVTQRATNRTTGATLLTGATAQNTVSATLTVPDQDPATDTADASLVIGPLTIKVTPGKTITPSVIPAGGTVQVNLSAKNDSNGPLTSLTITEPSASDADGFLSAQLTPAGFSSWTWPEGATGASFTWHFADAPDATVSLTEADGAPSVPASGTITGFEVTWTGEIKAGQSAGMVLNVATKSDMVAVGTDYVTRDNVVGVSGTNPAGTDTGTATDDVRIYYPKVGLAIDKTLKPALVTPGGTVLSELTTTTATDSARVNPTEIVVEDVWDGTGATDFWDAFRAREISYVQVPSGASLKVEYATGNPGAQTWTTLTGGTLASGLYSADLVALLGASTADSITGLRFTFTDPDGFSQGTIVKPNIVYQASATLRTGGSTAPVLNTASSYDNVGIANGTGKAGELTVTADEVKDAAATSVIDYGSGPGTLLAQKRWVQSNWSTDLTMLPSQSGSAAYTTHSWGVTVPGYTSVVLSDALPGQETTPASTTFQAFNLTAIRAITFTQDPLLQWDKVDTVELYNATAGAWQTVSAPAGSWMSATGFKGYTLTAAQQESTTGVRITVVPTDAARTASTAPGRPAAGTGVAWSAASRPLWLQWQLRNSLRAPATGWATAQVTYNEAAAGTVRNDFRVATTGTVYTRDASDTISLLDNLPGVGTAKVASAESVVVPYPGDVAQADYPTVRFTVNAWNTVTARASYLRVSDPSSTITPATAWNPDVFTTASYDPANNPFEKFTLTGIGFTTLSMIDRDASKVALWRYDAGATSVDVVTVNQAAALTASELADVVGVSVVYQSTDPATTGGLIPQGSSTANLLTMTLDTQLRATLRSTGANITGGVDVDNLATAQSYDPILGPASAPNAAGRDGVALLSAGLDVTASKSLSPDAILQTAPSVPVTVTLGATDGTSTAAAESATIADTDAEFWDAFAFTSLGSVTRPQGADLVRVDVQLDDSSTWVTGTAAATAALPGSVTDTEQITGIRFVFLNADGRPFSATAPSRDWSATAVFTVTLREGATFPSVIDDTVTTQATHTGYPDAGATADDSVTLSTGTPRIAVAKDPQVTPKVVEPGVSVPWTLTFTNAGTSYLHVNTLVDSLGPWLRYDGSEPTYASSGSLPETGIAVTQTAADNITFTFPDGAVMAPGDSFTATVGIILVPGLAANQRATNSFYVDTDETFTAGNCVNTSGNAQGILSGLESNQCGTSNFVNPQSGPLLFGEKEVRGEIDGDLVDGASNVTNASLPCTGDEGAFFRTTCVPYTTIGATDEWRIGAANTGTVAYSTLTLVDVLPTPGDRLLATGASRGSAWRPVLDVDFGVQSTVVSSFANDGLPAGTTTTVEVTTADHACLGDGSGSAWPSDPTCSSHPAAGDWQALASYTGDAADITALRVTLD